MKIGYINKKLEKECLQAKKYWGEIGEKLFIRLSDLAAFDNLSQVPSVPPHRCHPYEGSTLKFSVDLTRNYRLIFSPAGKYKVKDGVGIVRESVKEIIIEKIKDPH